MSRFAKPYFALFYAAMLFSPAVRAQNASPNADILKMIQAGLPEGAVVAKINEGAGRWDTSVDALIALKKAGATNAEINALTSALAAPAPMAMPVVTTAQPQALLIAGGTLHNTAAGDPYIQFPEAIHTLFPDGTKSNRAFLVSYEGKPAIRIPAAHLRRTLDNAEVSGNLLLTEETVLFDPYLAEEHLGAYPKNGKYVAKHDGAIHEDGFSIPRNKVNLNYEKLTYYSNNFASPRATSFSGNKHYNVGWHFIEDSNNCGVLPLCMSSELEDFVRGLVHDFSGTINPLLAAAGVTDADKQLSPEAHYHLLTKEDYPKIAAIYQRQLDGRSAPTKEHNGMAELAEITQIASAGASAVAQSSAGGNTIASQQSAMVQYNQNVATIESGGTPTLYTPPPVAAPQPVAATPAPAAPGKSGFKIEPKKPYQGTVTGGNSGTVAPPVAYAPPPSTSGTVVSAVCPASGFVPGLFKSYGDAATAVQCTPGQPIGSSPGAGSPPNSDSSSGIKTTPVLTNCLAQSYVNGDLTVTNTCNVPVYASWWINGHGGSWTLNPGEHTGTGYSSSDVAVGGADYYVCPKNASPADSSGHALTGPISSYVCVVRY